MKLVIASNLCALLCTSLLSLVHAATTSYPPLPSGCHADNVVNAIRNHGADAISYCNLLVPKTTDFVSRWTFYTTVTSGVSTTTSSYPARNTEFTNVYRGNGAYRDYKGNASYSDIPATLTPLTYSNNKPSIFTVQNADYTPTYLTSYDAYRIFSGCTCVITPTTTQTYSGYPTTITSHVRPISTSTSFEEHGQMTYPRPTYAAICDPSVYVRARSSAFFFKTVSANRPVQTISPAPKVRYKFDCCQLCADTFNCLWWRHSVSGACEYVWATDTNTNHSNYDQCINGYGGITTGEAADVHQADAFGVGTCAMYNSWYNEDQSMQGSTEWEFRFQDNCAVFGGAYCA